MVLHGAKSLCERLARVQVGRLVKSPLWLSSYLISSYVGKMQNVLKSKHVSEEMNIHLLTILVVPWVN